MDRESARAVAFMVLFFVGLPVAVGIGFSVWANHWPPEVARREADSKVVAADVAATEKRIEAERIAQEATMRSDIAKCSTVTDEIRCSQAFQCRNEPEQCVFEYGDPDIVLDGIREDAMNDDSRADY